VGLVSAIDSNISLDHGLSTTTGVITRTIPEETAVTGSYDGVAGQYYFDEATTLNWDGTDLSVTTGTGNFGFRADDPDVVIPDRDYLAFGVWTEIPDDPTNANPGRVRPFVHGNAGPYNAEQIAALAGDASYSGGAVGHWATRAAGSHMADEGRFTATATLNADFDGGLGATVLTGEITGFMDEESGAEMMGWLVNLNAGAMSDVPLQTADNAANQYVDPTDPMRIDVDGTTTGTTGSTSWSGVWEAWFHGNNPTDHPTGVAGNFQAEAGTAQPVQTDEARINLFEDAGFAGVVGSFAGRQQP
jgi:hypothetical protein